ncbi:MAG: signal peptidase II [Phycisphaerales bacterium]|nr:signal peptidase II [Phycisphaerales bacterium]
MQVEPSAPAVEQVNPPRDAAAAPPIAHEMDTPAWYERKAHLVFWLVAACGLALDLVSKEWIFHHLRQSREPMSVIPSVIDFQTMFNGGALFGIGQGQTSLFLVASVVALTLVVWMFACSSARRKLLHVALAGILAGALGNMYDRSFVRLVEYPIKSYRYFVREDLPDGRIRLVEYPPAPNARQIELPPSSAEFIGPELGYVRDFIKISTAIRGQSIYPWIFNVADMLLVGGVGILAIQLLFERQSRAAADSPPQIAA